MLILFLPVAHLDQHDQCWDTANNKKYLIFLSLLRESSSLSYHRASWPFMCNCWLSVLPAAPIIIGAKGPSERDPFPGVLKTDILLTNCKSTDLSSGYSLGWTGNFLTASRDSSNLPLVSSS